VFSVRPYVDGDWVYVTSVGSSVSFAEDFDSIPKHKKASVFAEAL
jgi:hypothetical protein